MGHHQCLFKYNLDGDGVVISVQTFTSKVSILSAVADSVSPCVRPIVNFYAVKFACNSTPLPSQRF